MLSKADSFPIKNIRASGIEEKDNPSKNIQIYIPRKKVKTKNKTNLDSQNEVHSFYRQLSVLTY